MAGTTKDTAIHVEGAKFFEIRQVPLRVAIGTFFADKNRPFARAQERRVGLNEEIFLFPRNEKASRLESRQITARMPTIRKSGALQRLNLTPDRRALPTMIYRMAGARDTFFLCFLCRRKKSVPPDNGLQFAGSSNLDFGHRSSQNLELPECGVPPDNRLSCYRYIRFWPPLSQNVKLAVCCLLARHERARPTRARNTWILLDVQCLIACSVVSWRRAFCAFYHLLFMFLASQRIPLAPSSQRRKKYGVLYFRASFFCFIPKGTAWCCLVQTRPLKCFTTLFFAPISFLLNTIKSGASQFPKSACRNQRFILSFLKYSTYDTTFSV